MSGTLRRRRRGGGKRVCPNCGRKFATRPAMMLHLWAEALAAETDRPVDEVESALKRFRDEGLLRVNTRTGDLLGEWGAMGRLGEDIQEVLAEVGVENAEDRRRRLAEFQARGGVQRESS